MSAFSAFGIAWLQHEYRFRGSLISSYRQFNWSSVNTAVMRLLQKTSDFSSTLADFEVHRQVMPGALPSIAPELNGKGRTVALPALRCWILAG
jgi:hypothetical protein